MVMFKKYRPAWIVPKSSGMRIVSAKPSVRIISKNKILFMRVIYEKYH